MAPLFLCVTAMIGSIVFSTTGSLQEWVMLLFIAHLSGRAMAR